MKRKSGKERKYYSITWLGILSGIILFFSVQSSAQVLYKWDDGTIESGMTSGATSEALALNSFTVQPGGEVIYRISGYWWSVNPVGAPARVVLFKDPNNDGNPIDAQLLAEVPTTIGPSNSFFSVDIPPTIVSGVFFVGVVWLNPNGTLWLGSDTDTITNHSWLARSDNNGQLNLQNLALNFVPPSPVGSFGTIMVRAEGMPKPTPVPTLTEWGMIMLTVLLGIGSVCYLRRRRPTV